MTGGTGSAGRLVELARSTLLMDEYGGWFRYHHLLREFLVAELRAREPDRVADLHRRAAAWHADAGELDLAVAQAFSAADLDLAASFVGRMMLDNHWSGRRALTQSWLARFSDPELEERPWLAILAAWECIGTGDAPRALHFADIAERGSFTERPPDGTASFESSRAMLRTTMGRHGADDMLANAWRAVELEPEGSPWRDFALWMLSIALFTRGDREAGDAAVTDALTAARSARHEALTYCILGHRAQRAVDQGDWAAAVGLMDEARDTGAAILVEGFLASIPSVIAGIRILVHRGEVEAARRELTRAVSLRPAMGIDAPAASVMFLLGLTWAHLAVADPPARARSCGRPRTSSGGVPTWVSWPRKWRTRARPSPRCPAGFGGASTLTAAELARASDAALLPLLQGGRAAPRREGHHGQDACPVRLREARGLLAQRGRGPGGGGRAPGAVPGHRPGHRPGLPRRGGCSRPLGMMDWLQTILRLSLEANTR